MSGVGVRTAPSTLVRWIILGVVGVLFLIPLASMLEFTLRRGLAGGYDFSRWTALFGGELTTTYKSVIVALGNSVVLAIGTVIVMLVILVPTMILVQLRFPKLRRMLEFVSLLPITIPAIVLVVGLAPIYSVVARLFGSGVWTLSLAYGILVLPFAYRAIATNLAAVDIITLSEAARSLGASWFTVLWRVLVPNLRRGLLAASFISIALVLGEYTIASLLNRVNLQTALVVVSKTDPFVAVILALLALVTVFVLLLIIGRVGRIGERRGGVVEAIASPTSSASSEKGTT